MAKSEEGSKGLEFADIGMDMCQSQRLTVKEKEGERGWQVLIFNLPTPILVSENNLMI